MKMKMKIKMHSSSLILALALSMTRIAFVPISRFFHIHFRCWLQLVSAVVQTVCSRRVFRAKKVLKLCHKIVFMSNCLGLF